MRIGIFFLSYLCLLVGCSSNSGEDSDSNEDIRFVDHCLDPVATVDENGNFLVIANDRLNYRFQSNLVIETVRVRSLSDIRFDWSGVNTDMLEHSFDPFASVDMMEVMLWRYSKEDLVRDINSDSLDTSRLVTMGKVQTQNTISAANFLDVRAPNGGEVDDEELLAYVDTSVYPLEEHTYFVMIADGSIFGRGTKMISFFDPLPDETNIEVRMTNNSTKLEYDVDLTSLKRIAVPPNTPNIVLDWIDNYVLEKNALGGEWVPTKITDVMVAHYIDKTPEELEDVFLNLEEMADETWQIFLSVGQSINFGRLNTEADNSGEFFSGIDETGTWVVALKCGDCANPAPWFLSILHPCPGMSPSAQSLDQDS